MIKILIIVSCFFSSLQAYDGLRRVEGIGIAESLLFPDCSNVGDFEAIIWEARINARVDAENQCNAPVDQISEYKDTTHIVAYCRQIIGESRAIFRCRQFGY